MQKQAITCFLIKDDKILLAESDYRLNQRTWNGISGFITNTQRIGQETVKILYDAIKVQAYPNDLEQVGVQHIYELKADQTREETVTITIFICKKWLGEPRLTGNFKPSWFAIDELPYKDMFSDTKDWLPKLIEGEKLIIEVITTVDNQTQQTKIVDVNIRSIFE